MRIALCFFLLLSAAVLPATVETINRIQDQQAELQRTYGSR